MNGTNGNEPGYPENALVPYPVIVVATMYFRYSRSTDGPQGVSAWTVSKLRRKREGCKLEHGDMSSRYVQKQNALPRYGVRGSFGEPGGSGNTFSPQSRLLMGGTWKNG